MCSQDSIGVVPPPNTQTVKKTISSVVENIIWRAEVAVSRMARANAIAPRSPGEGHTHKNNNHIKAVTISFIDKYFQTIQEEVKIFKLNVNTFWFEFVSNAGRN